MTTDSGARLGRRMIDMDKGTVARDIFVDPDIYRLELERVFARAWLFVGHESQVPNPDDYFISRMGEESVILTRDRQNQLHVLLNTCTHRGMKVVRYDEGNTRTFSCPYHGWSFSTDGSLVSVPGELLGVPQYRAAYHEQLDKQEWGLIQVARMVNYKGGIWATWDPDAPSFEQYIGGALGYLDELFDHRAGRAGGAEVIGGVLKWRVPSNWKFVSENFAGDMYHGISHQSVEIVGIGPDGRGRTRQGVTNRPRHGITSFPALGHGVRGGAPAPEAYYPFPHFPHDPVIEEYFQQCYRERQERLAGQDVPWGNGGNIFPNMSWHARFPRTILVSHPVSANETEMWRFCLVDADAPAEVKQLYRTHFLRYSGPAGMTEQDDMENWNYASAASNGVIARRKPYNYQLGLGWSHPSPLPGALESDHVMSEENARTLYTRWAAMMDAE